MRHSDWDGPWSGPVQYGGGQQNTSFGGDVNSSVYGSVTSVTYGSGMLPADVEAGFSSILTQLEELRLSRSERETAAREVHEAQKSLASSKPDNRSATQHLQNLLSVLEKAGSAASALDPIGKAIGTIARVLGPAGASLMAAL